MNRIILIGNGFDLAHGLKTSYADFIDWYWGEWGKRLLHSDNKIEQDRFCSFKLSKATNLNMWYMAWQGYYYKKSNPFLPWDVHEVVNIAKQDAKLCEFKIKDFFFEEICKSVETKGWVDIENLYYVYLSHKNQNYISPKDANNDLEIIREKLIEYLSGVQKEISDDMVKDKLKAWMIESFKESDISHEGLNQGNIKMEFLQAKMKKTRFSPERILMLNFNYTTLADLYLPKSCIHIHGELSNPKSVIFGYGDELDADYKKLSEKNDNEYLRNIKSIKYLESPNYRNLLGFIEASPYQVYIMGHSCGNSDRTLLNTLFEHRNCYSIKPFYYIKEDGTDNFIELAQNISRNFTDMKLMRDRVVNKTFCEPYSDAREPAGT